MARVVALASDERVAAATAACFLIAGSGSPRHVLDEDTTRATSVARRERAPERRTEQPSCSPWQLLHQDRGLVRAAAVVGDGDRVRADGQRPVERGVEGAACPTGRPSTLQVSVRAEPSPTARRGRVWNGAGSVGSRRYVPPGGGFTMRSGDPARALLRGGPARRRPIRWPADRGPLDQPARPRPRAVGRRPVHDRPPAVVPVPVAARELPRRAATRVSTRGQNGVASRPGERADGRAARGPAAGSASGGSRGRGQPAR